MLFVDLKHDARWLGDGVDSRWKHGRVVKREGKCMCRVGRDDKEEGQLDGKKDRWSRGKKEGWSDMDVLENGRTAGRYMEQGAEQNETRVRIWRQKYGNKGGWMQGQGKGRKR